MSIRDKNFNKLDFLMQSMVKMSGMAEAHFNILDNAVKYSGQGGKLSVNAQCWETVTKIDITDTGKGSTFRYINEIWKITSIEHMRMLLSRNSGQGNVMSWTYKWFWESLLYIEVRKYEKICL